MTDQLATAITFGAGGLLAVLILAYVWVCTRV